VLGGDFCFLFGIMYRLVAFGALSDISLFLPSPAESKFDSCFRTLPQQDFNLIRRHRFDFNLPNALAIYLNDSLVVPSFSDLFSQGESRIQWEFKSQ